MALLLQVVLSGGDAPCSVVQTPDQSSLDMRYGTRIKKVNVLRAYYGYGRTTTMATGVLRLRLRAYDAYGYGRATLTATGVLV